MLSTSFHSVFITEFIFYPFTQLVIYFNKQNMKISLDKKIVI